VDRPGVSATNALQAAGIGANMTAAGRIGRIGALGGQAVVNTGLRSLAQGAGQAATELGKQGLSVAGGSKQGIEGEPIIQAGVGGALAEPAVAIVQGGLRGAGRVLGRRPAQPLMTPAAMQLPGATPVQPAHLNATTRRLLEQAGVDVNNLPADVTLDTLHRWSTMMPTMNSAARALADTPEAREIARRTFQSAR